MLEIDSIGLGVIRIDIKVTSVGLRVNRSYDLGEIIYCYL